MALQKTKKLAYEVLLSRKPEEQVIYVLDALNLERGLQFLLQIIDMGVPTLVVLTMKDVLEKKRIQLNLEKLKKSIGLQFVLVNAKSGEGIDTLKEVLKNPNSFQKRPRIWTWGTKEESFLTTAKRKLGITTNEAEFFLSQSLKYLNKDPHLSEERYFAKFPEETKTWLRSAVEGKGYHFYYQEEMIYRSFLIKKVLADVITYPKSVPGSWEEKLDRILLHPILGFVCFFFLYGASFPEFI